MTTEELVTYLGGLGVNNMITKVSESSYTVDVSTLEALIILAQENRLSTPACQVCGSSFEAMLYKDADGKLVAYCFECLPDGTTEYRRIP